jgi:hypothetical protein
MRTKLGALLGAGGLLLLAASATIAAPPTYTISVSKTASPASVPVSGGTVAFTVWVTGTGTGFFQTVSVTDPLAGCTIGAKVETSGDADDKLEQGETWSYSCTVNNVTPGTENTATVHACHNVSTCNQDAHDAQGQGAVTVTEGEAPPPSQQPSVAPSVAPSVDPSVDPGSPDPTQDNAGLTQAPTDTVGQPANPIGSQRTLLLVLALGMLLASLVLVTPARPVRARTTNR